MIVGTVRIDLSLPGVNSLKEKRRRLKSLLARIRNKFNVSIAEVEFNDSLKMARLGAAVVSNDKKYCERVISKLVNAIENHGEVVLTDYRVEVL